MTKKKKYDCKYQLEVTWSEEDKAYIINAPELPGCMTHGETVEKALQNAYEAIEGYLESLEARGLPIPTPLSEKKFSGKIPLRLEPSLHRDLMTKAKIAKMSLNKFIETKLKKAV